MSQVTVTHDYDTEPQISELRDLIGDAVKDAGPRWQEATTAPSNFSDGAYRHYLTVEGTVGRTAARFNEILAGEWRKAAESVETGPIKERAGNKAKGYMQEAARLRARYGWPEDDDQEAEGAFGAELVR